MEICWAKNLTNDAGVTVGYWKMLSINVDVQSGMANVLCGGWVSEQAKNEGKEMVLDHNFRIDFNTFDPNGQIVAGLLQLVQAAQVSL